MKRIEQILDEVEAESQDTVAGSAVQFLVVSKGTHIRALQTLMG